MSAYLFVFWSYLAMCESMTYAVPYPDTKEQYLSWLPLNGATCSLTCISLSEPIWKQSRGALLFRVWPQHCKSCFHTLADSFAKQIDGLRTAGYRSSALDGAGTLLKRRGVSKIPTAVQKKGDSHKMSHIKKKKKSRKLVVPVVFSAPPKNKSNMC